MLYELYLEEAGHKNTYDKTKGFSLGHIVTFSEIYDLMADEPNTLELVNITRGLAGMPQIAEVSEMKDKDFSVVSSIKELNTILNDEDVEVLTDVINKIDEYHDNK